ncbi:MAG: Tex family protein [Anaerolineales bacterium]
MTVERSYDKRIADALSLSAPQVAAAIRLLEEGNTVPFIARYRKEMTGSLDEDQLRQLHGLLSALQKLDDRRETILNSIEQQGQLTDDLAQRIRAAATLTELEDLYQPYKPKRRTRASMARERGLAPLAEQIVIQPTQGPPPQESAQAYLSDEVPDIAAALAGARDIVAEQISDDPTVRGTVRDKALRFGHLYSEKIVEADDEKNVYLNYYAFDQRVGRLRPYQVLAINRGEAEKILRVRLELQERDWRDPISDVFRVNQRSPWAEELHLAIEDAAKRLLLPAIERDVRAALTETAEAHAIDVFADNLHGLLNQPPLTGHVVLGVDPAYRTGCKLAVIDDTGKVLYTGTIYPHKPQGHWAEALQKLAGLVQQFSVTLIAIGNGTASRETEQLIAELTREREGVHYLIVNEAGASVYSASSLARAELPELDVSLRGAVSIARRVQDPLAELVKIDPRSIGVGMYQHDVNQKDLSTALDGVVETVVNRVGVDVNTASPALLTYVAGIGPKLAENIVAYREENGGFSERTALKKVPKLGAKAFEQSAGFLRIRGGKNPLDASAIHPESYNATKKLLKEAGLQVSTPPEKRGPQLDALRQKQSLSTLAETLSVGLPTLQDIFEQLMRPGRDPREDLPAPILRSDVMRMEDLQIGMVLKGTVRNVVDFGAFVDIGVKQDGLLHVSQVPRGVSLSVGEVVPVEILTVEIERGRIGLGWIEPKHS